MKVDIETIWAAYAEYKARFKGENFETHFCGPAGQLNILFVAGWEACEARVNTGQDKLADYLAQFDYGETMEISLTKDERAAIIACLRNAAIEASGEQK